MSMSDLPPCPLLDCEETDHHYHYRYRCTWAPDGFIRGVTCPTTYNGRDDRFTAAQRAAVCDDESATYTRCYGPRKADA